MADGDPEQNLLDAAINGDTVALERLLLTHFSALERYVAPRIPARARRQLATEDILQEVFSQAFRDLAQLRSTSSRSMLAWLKSIADHRLYDALKRIGRKKRGGDHHQLSNADVAKTSTVATLIDLVCHDSNLPDKSAARREAAKVIQVAVASLPKDQCDVIRARYFDNQSVDEIAVATGRTMAAVRGLIHRGKKKLAEAMGRSSRWLSRR
jgi:RNA polymerase sigma-70 factor (ECF subfamily)